MSDTTATKDYSWVSNIIESCVNEFQLECVDKLIELFKVKYPEENSGFTDRLIEKKNLQLFKIKNEKSNEQSR